MQHQLILWQGPGDPCDTKAWEECLREAAIVPFEARTPDERVESYFMASASRYHCFRWRETPEMRERDDDILQESEWLARHAVICLSSMLLAHERCLPGSKYGVPKVFGAIQDRRFGMVCDWLQVLYECVSEWPKVLDAPAWMPKTRETTGTKGKVKLVESSDVWALSG